MARPALKCTQSPAALTAVLYDPVFAKIEFKVDVDGRTAFMAVPRVVEAPGQPIRNPVTGDPHRARVSL